MKITDLKVKLIVISLALCIVVPSMSLDAEEKKQDAKVIEYIVAKVNNEVITSSELQEAIEAMKKSKDADKKSEDEIKRLALDNIITTKLVLSISKLFKIEAPARIINSRIEAIKKENSLETDDQLNEQLKLQGVSLPWLREELRKSYIYQNVIIKNVYGRIKVTEDEIKDFYARNIRRYSKESVVRIRQIFISIADKDTLDARSRINEALDKLKAGADFKDILNSYADVAARANDGDLGSFKKGEVVKEIDEAAFALNEGDFSEVIQTDNGFHIIQVTEKKMEEKVPISSVRDEIVNTLKSSRIQKETVEYMKELKRDYYVEILDPDLKKYYEESSEKKKEKKENPEKKEKQ